MNDIAIVVASFDGYKDIWPVFIKAIEKNWEDCPYKIYMVSNFEIVNSDRIISICVGDEISWCDRMEKALKKVSEKNIILLLEDYLIGEKVDTKTVQHYVDLFNEKQMKYLRIIDIPKSTDFHGDNIIPIFENLEYGINLQPSIWDKTYLLNLLGIVEGKKSAWDFEVALLKKAQKGKRIPLKGCYSIKFNLLNIHNGVLKGKWFPNEVKYFEKIGIKVNTNFRRTLSFNELFVYKIRLTLREVMSTKMRKKMKKRLKKIGFKFASDE